MFKVTFRLKIKVVLKKWLTHLVLNGKFLGTLFFFKSYKANVTLRKKSMYIYVESDIIIISQVENMGKKVYRRNIVHWSESNYLPLVIRLL